MREDVEELAARLMILLNQALEPLHSPMILVPSKGLVEVDVHGALADWERHLFSFDCVSCFVASEVDQRRFLFLVLTSSVE
mmetsp:Transcript_22833/g.38269  ORF Transcript_22833/g.38269 Transcript_22833/m.38269 type:complete len:81 (+) Transcript_22833:41-283(+)